MPIKAGRGPESPLPPQFLLELLRRPLEPPQLFASGFSPIFTV
jgi:hypothetical protein